MIKVCHMTSAHAPGDVRIFHKECVSLGKAGYQVYLVQRGESYEASGVHVIGVGQPSGGRLARMTAFSKKVYETARALDADIYHFHDPELLPYGHKLKKLGKIVIFDSHEIYEIQMRKKPYLPDWAAALMAMVYTHYERYVVHRLDGAVVPCLRADKPFFGGAARRLVTVDNTPKLEELYDRYDPESSRDSRQVCYVGGLTEARGITVSIQAAHAAGCRLALAGLFSPAGYEARLRAMPEFSCVDYRGMLDREEITALLNASGIGLCLMARGAQFDCATNFNVKTYEYMAMGIPVILSCNAFNRKLLDKWNFGICVDPGNVEEITGAIRYLLDHPEEARRMGENGRRAVKEAFNWNVEEAKLLELYAELCTAGGKEVPV